MEWYLLSKMPKKVTFLNNDAATDPDDAPGEAAGVGVRVPGQVWPRDPRRALVTPQLTNCGTHINPMEPRGLAPVWPAGGGFVPPEKDDAYSIRSFQID